MNLIEVLIVGHLIADFPLQTGWIYRFKTESWLGVVLHSSIHVLVTALLVRPLPAAWPMLAILGILHFITDFTKLQMPTKRQSPGFVADQLVHLLVVLLLGYYWQGVVFAALPSILTLPLILYGSFLGLMIFFWVLACDLAKGDWGEHPTIQWAKDNLLMLSQYAGLSLVFFLAQRWHRNIERSS